MFKPKTIQLTCTDGVTLAALLVEPVGSPRAAVVINGGTGYKKEFYLNFADYLAENGFAVLTYDYRGTCASAPADMRHCAFHFLEYGEKDMPAALDFMVVNFPDAPQFIVGHSVGGQQIGLMENHDKIDGLFSVCTSVGYLGFMPWKFRLKSAFFFYLFTPLSILLKGYVVAKPFKLMENLPRRVVLDWRKWCSVPDYFFDKRYYGISVPTANFKNFAFPIVAYWTTDDPIANERSVSLFWSHIHSSKGITLKRLVPAEWGISVIDHDGFFRKKSKEKLWHLALMQLNEWCSARTNLGR